ncbi:MAG: hypothetical protein ACRD6X_08325 [Pyrinomonadaceae bacterium]
MAVFTLIQRKTLVAAIILFAAASVSVIAQQERYSDVKSQEISESDGVPVLMKHLPEWENVKSSAVFIQDTNALKSTLGSRPVFEFVEFSGGTEAVFANYQAGKLLIIEYTTPQASVYADAKFTTYLAENPSDPPTVYRRIGNYSAFVFDAGDQNAAIGLLDQIAYEKKVQWLGEDPFLLAKIERYFAVTGRDVAISAVLWIVMWLGIVIVVGIASGFLFFNMRERKRASRTAFSDAGGLTRLNLDELSEPITLD